MLALLLALQSGVPDPPAYDGSKRQLDVTPPRVEVDARVDGVLDEPVWQRAAHLIGFSQYRPVDGRPAEDSTEVLVWYAPDAVWFGVRAYEQHGHVVRATLADRDNIDADDNIQILLDTYADHRRALLFAVNPLGVQEDGVRSEGQDAGAAGGGASAIGRFDGVIDLSPDFVYQSRGHVTDWGYEVEVRIPFKSLRFQSTDPQTWGLQVVRVVQHSGYENTWTPVLRANASFLIQSGRLTGLTGLKRGLVLDLTPEFTSKVDGTPAAAGYDYRGTPELGGNLRWGITQNLGLSATAHPDFSQVEADVGQVTVNERFALFYPEKRPFFLEGLEQFDTPNRLMYTRRIVQPVFGAKLAGKIGGTGIAYLGAVDNRDSATGANPVYNLVRLRRDLGPTSTVGITYTDRIDGDAYNRVLSADARVVWRSIWFSEVQLGGAWTRDGTGARAGKLWDVTFADRTGRAYGNHFELLGIERTFQDTSGFVNRVDLVAGRTFNRFTWYGRPGALLEQVSAIVGFAPIWRYADFGRLRGTVEDTLQNSWVATLRGGWALNLTLSLNHFSFDPAAYVGETVNGAPFVVPNGLYHLPGIVLGGSTPNRALAASATVIYGAAALFPEAAEGRQFSVVTTAAWRPTPSLRVEVRWVHEHFTRARDGSRFSTANIPRLKVEYQLSRAIFFRYVGQYFAQDQAALEDPRTGQPILGPRTAAVVTNEFRNDVLFSYKPVPGTVCFFGYGASLTELDAFQFRSLSRGSDGFFLKLSYLFRM